MSIKKRLGELTVYTRQTNYFGDCNAHLGYLWILKFTKGSKGSLLQGIWVAAKIPNFGR